MRKSSNHQPDGFRAARSSRRLSCTLGITVKRVLATFLAAQAWNLASAAEPRPTGSNCNLSQPPAESGEEDGHGFVLLVFPRTGDIGPKYSGCQAVFATSRSQGTRLAWVVEVSRGEPIRMWSTDSEMKDVLQCRYRNRELQWGSPDVCPPVQSLLMPTQPAGCFTGKSAGAKCDYDIE